MLLDTLNLRLFGLMLPVKSVIRAGNGVTTTGQGF